MKKNKMLLRDCRVQIKVSTHYLIKKNGEILVLVPDLYEAWHAGLSNWKNYKNLNKLDWYRNY